MKHIKILNVSWLSYCVSSNTHLSESNIIDDN